MLLFLRLNKSPVSNEINFDTIKYCFGELCGPFKYSFDSLLQTKVFSDLMKITIVLPVFKTCYDVDISNYHDISAHPCFSKILERVMYNCLNK